MAYANNYTALLTGSYWNGIEVAGQPSFVTYSFDATAPASDQANLSPSAYATFTPFTAAQQQEAQQALGEWSGNSGLIFEEVAPGKGDINFAAYDFSSDPANSAAGGIGFYPWGNWDYATYPYFSADQPGSGNILMNTAYENGGLFDYATVLHEEGHALGLKHPDQAWTDYATNPPTVHNQWSPNKPLPSSVMNEGATTLTHLAAIDIQAIQAAYGKPTAQGSKDNSWSWDSTTNTLTQHVSNRATMEVRGISTNNILYAGAGNDSIFAIGAGSNTIYAGRGSDLLVGGSGTNRIYAGTGADSFIGTFGPTTVDYSRASAAVTVDLLDPGLNAGAASDDSFTDIHALRASNHGDTLTADNAGDTITGGTGNDSVVGGGGADRLVGGAGNDTLLGGGGADVLTGGLGADVFAYAALNESTVVVAGRDTITDFSSSQGDVVDLSALATSTGQPLTFIGTAAFDGIPGELRYSPSGANTLVSIDDTGSGKADFAILLSGVHTLSASDFRLSGMPAAPAQSMADTTASGTGSVNASTTVSDPTWIADRSGEGGETI